MVEVVVVVVVMVAECQAVSRRCLTHLTQDVEEACEDDHDEDEDDSEGPWV